MRRIVMFNRVTPEGYFAGPDGSLEWVVPEEEVDRAAAAAIPSFDTFLLGRRTYELFAAFWPHVSDDPAVPAPHGAGPLSGEQRAMGSILNAATKLVFSRTLKELTWKNSRLLRNVDPGEISAMKRQPGNDMMVLGSASIVSQLTQHGLIDEYQFAVSPVLLGRGQPLLTGMLASIKLDHRDAGGYLSGTVLLRYTRSGPATR